jgi:hypothetical protein
MYTSPLSLFSMSALSLNGYRPPTSDRHLIVKYAEDQHKKKDRRMGPGHMMGGSPIGMGMGGMNMSMMESSMMSGMGHKTDTRDPYYFQRSRMSQGVYGSHQQQHQRGSGGMDMPQQMGNVMGVTNQMNQMYMPASTLMYSAARGKNMVGPGISQGASMDWFAQMPQMVYDTQYTGGQQMHLTLDHMMAQAQAQVQSHTPTAAQRQQLGGNMSYSRSPRSAAHTHHDSDLQGGSATLIISGLPHNADLALLNDLCAPYGRVLDAQIDTDRRGDDPKNDVWCGRGRVQIVGMAQAQYAMQALNGVVIFEGGKPLHVSIVYPGSGAGIGSAGEHMNRARR